MTVEVGRRACYRVALFDCDDNYVYGIDILVGLGAPPKLVQARPDITFVTKTRFKDVRRLLKAGKAISNVRNGQIPYTLCESISIGSTSLKCSLFCRDESEKPREQMNREAAVMTVEEHKSIITQNERDQSASKRQSNRGHEDGGWSDTAIPPHMAADSHA